MHLVLILLVSCGISTVVSVRPRIQYHEGPSFDCKSVPHHVRDRRAVVNFNDPMYTSQWYLNDNSGVSMNIKKAWEAGYTGKGVVISVVDTGLDHTNDEFKGRYDQKASFDFVGNDTDPLPEKSGGNHGTKVGGTAAGAANNKKCGVGVAYEANIGGIKFIDVTDNSKDVEQAQAISYARDYIDIYACAWGPDDRIGSKVGYNLVPGAMEDGTKYGRKGKGSIFVFSAGNEGIFLDMCNYDGYINSIHTIALSTINSDGTKGKVSERCPSIMAVTYTRDGATGIDVKTHLMPTADTDNKCNEIFSASSAATAIGSGVFALVLQANPNLTWRDLQHLIANTSINDPAIAKDENFGWHTNGAGYKVSDVFGFGILDAMALINMAKVWNKVPDQLKCEYDRSANKEISALGSLEETVDFADFTSCGIKYLEHVVLVLNVTFSPRKYIQVELTSPTKMLSYMLLPRRFDVGKEIIMFPTMSLHHWGENPTGTWSIKFKSTNAGSNGTLSYFKLILYGTNKLPEPPITTKPIKTTETIKSTPATTNTKITTPKSKAVQTKAFGFFALVLVSLASILVGLNV